MRRLCDRSRPSSSASKSGGVAEGMGVVVLGIVAQGLADAHLVEQGISLDESLELGFAFSSEAIAEQDLEFGLGELSADQRGVSSLVSHHALVDELHDVVQISEIVTEVSVTALAHRRIRSVELLQRH